MPDTTRSGPDRLAIPSEREAGLREVLAALDDAERVVLTTHVNADGDGAGSEAAIAAWLEEEGKRATIVNPTRYPEVFRFLLHRDDLAPDLGTPEAELALREADLFLVLDTSEANRVQPLVEHLDPARTLVVDHHPAGPTAVGRRGVQDPSAAATGELVFDLLTLAAGPWPPSAVQGMYVALVSDTGSFRFGNTNARAHAVAAELLARGVDPERMYQRLFATFPRRRIELLREALGNLHVESDLGLAWIVVPREVTSRLRSTSEDFDGLIDHARSVEGTRVAVLFRELADGGLKVSFRSSGPVDVNRIARDFGGGGHVRASGATIPATLSDGVEKVLERVREALRDGG